MAFVLSEADIKFIQELKAEVSLLRKNVPSRPPQEECEDHQAPETYIAYPKTAAGIPAMSGTTPGKATCDIWKIVDDELIDAGFFKEVYNLSTSAVTQRYIPTTRTKYGKWIVEPGGGGAIRMGTIAAYVGTSTPGSGTGSGSADICDSTSVTDGLYYVDLLTDDSLSEPASNSCEVAEYPNIEKFCCSIIDEETGEYIGCVGDDIDNTVTGTGSGTSDALDCTGTLSGGGPSGDVDERVIAYDLPGRVLDVGTSVAVAVIGSVYVIVEAAIPSVKICFLSDIACATDCDGNSVFLKSYTPIWFNPWKVCDGESEFIPECPEEGGSGTGSGTDAGTGPPA